MNTRDPKFQLVTGFGVVILLLCLLTVMGISRMQAINKELELVVNVHNLKRDLALEMRYAARNRVLALYDMLVVDDPFHRDDQFLLFREEGSRFVRARERLQGMHLKGDELELFNRLRERIGAGGMAQYRVIELLNDEDAQGARAVMVTTTIPAQNATFDLIDEFVLMQRDKSRHAYEAAKATFEQAYTWMLLFGVAAILASLWIAAYTVRHVSTMIQALNRAGRQLQKSNADLRHEVNKSQLLAEKLRHSEERERAIRQNMAEAVLTIDEQGIIDSCNPATETLFAYARDELLGQSVKVLMPEPYASEQEGDLARYVATGETGIIGKGSQEVIARRKDGGDIHVERGVSELALAGKRLFVVIFRDIAGRKAGEDARDEPKRGGGLQEAGEHLELALTEPVEDQVLPTSTVNYDALTGLPNHTLFGEHLRVALAQCKRNKRQLALLVIGLDGLASVNDKLDRDAADELLKEVAKRIADCLRESDMVARIGGDAFTAIVPNVHEIAHIESVARKLIDDIAKPCVLGDHTAEVGASVGISVYPTDTLAQQTLVEYADGALREVKKSGKNRFLFHKDVRAQEA